MSTSSEDDELSELLTDEGIYLDDGIDDGMLISLTIAKCRSILL